MYQKNQLRRVEFRMTEEMYEKLEAITLNHKSYTGIMISKSEMINRLIYAEYMELFGVDENENPGF